MPEIVRLDVRAIAPDVARFRYTNHTDEVYTTTTLVTIVDADGARGVGAYDSDSFGAWDLAPLETIRPLAHGLIGLEAGDRDRISAILTQEGTSPFPPAVRSAIDTALWDLAARRDGRSLREFLGGAPTVTSLPSYASVPLLEDETTYLASIERWVDAGYAAVKLHAWGDPERDAELVRRVRETFPDLTLMHDAEGRYHRAGAELVASACADVGARWFEAPLPDFDLDGYRWLRRAVPGVPVLAAGDAIWDPLLMDDVLRDPPWDAVRFDVSFVGGPTTARRLMGVAADHGLDVELISYGHTLIQATNLHVALAHGRTTHFEQAVPTEPFEHGVRNPIRTDREGRVHAPEGPGLGIELDERALEEATLALVTAT